MTREEQIREAAYMASMTEEIIVREEVIKSRVNVGYKDVKLRDSERPIARLFFRKGVEWADANPCTPSRVINIPECLKEEMQELLANWKGKITVGSDISLSPWISVEERLPTKGELVIVITGSGELYLAEKDGLALSKDEFADSHLGCYIHGVTHWMPIPELPKEE